MTRISERHYQEDNSNAIVGDPNLYLADHYALFNQAQAAVGQEIGRAIMAGARWIGDQGTNVWQALADVTRPPAATA